MSKENNLYIQPVLFENSQIEMRSEIKSLVSNTLSHYFYESHRNGIEISLPKKINEIHKNEMLRIGYRSLINLTKNFDETDLKTAGFETRDELFDESLEWIAEIWTYENAANIKNPNRFLSKDEKKVIFRKNYYKISTILKKMALKFKNPVIQVSDSINLK